MKNSHSKRFLSILSLTVIIIVSDINFFHSSANPLDVVVRAGIANS